MSGKCQFQTCMDDTGIFPNLNVTLGWEKVPASAAPSAEDFLALSKGCYRPWIHGQSGHYGMHKTPNTDWTWPLAEQSGGDFRPGSPGTHVGLICCTSAQSGAPPEAEPAAPDRHQKEDSCWRQKQALRFPKFTWILPVKPTLLSSSSIQMTLFLFKYAFSKSKITGVSRALLEPLRIAFIFFLNLKSK